MKSKQITIISMLTAVCIILGYIEFLFPLPVTIPGIKLGLSNILILTCLYLFDEKHSWFVMLLKVVICNLLFSTPTMFLYSLFGGIFSLFVMSTMKKLKFNIITVSIGGGIFHNIGQLFAACLILKSLNIFYYLPILLITGTIFSVATGICANILYKRLSKII